MEKTDYKHFVFELISSIKSKVDFVENEKKGLTKDEYEGMKIAYNHIMDDLLFLMKEFELNLDEYGLRDINAS